MGLLWFSNKKKALASIQPPAPGPEQAKTNAQNISELKAKLEPTIPENPIPEQHLETPPAGEMPPSFDLPPIPKQGSDPSVNPPTASVVDEPKFEDLPKFENTSHFDNLKTEIEGITPEENLPSFENQIPKIENGITKEQKEKLEEVVKSAPTKSKSLGSGPSSLTTDMIKAEMDNHQKEELKIANELEDFSKHIEDPSKLISYDNEITHSVQSPTTLNVKEEMDQVVEQELDKQVSQFSLHELELDHKKVNAVVVEQSQQKNVQKPIVDGKAPTKAPKKIAKKHKHVEKIVPLEKVKSDELLSKEKYYLQKGPIFVFIDKYKYMLDQMHQSKACLKSMEEVSKNVFEINKNEDILHQKLVETFEKIQESLIYVDSTIFEQD